MSVLIADGGATSTTWAEIKGDQEQVLRTSGINPSLKVDAEIESVVFDELGPLINSSAVDKIYYYGAGCASFERANRVKSILKEAFRNAEIEIKSDIEGAGISIFGPATGIVAISGTGSSAGFMDGGSLVDVMPSKAYPEGDFGSGAHIGSLIMKDFYTGKAPIEIKNLIESRRRLSIDQLFVLFQDPTKSKLIASKVVADVVTSKEFDNPIHKEYLKRLIFEALEPFFNQLRVHFKNALAVHSLRFVGGTVAVFEDEFREYFKKKGLIIDEVQRTPIHGLIGYHKNQ
jgi:hypothetical protein